MELDLIQEMIKQVLEEIKVEGVEVSSKEEYGYGVFDSMVEAIDASEKAQKELFECSVQQRDKFVDAIRAEILKKENLENVKT